MQTHQLLGNPSRCPTSQEHVRDSHPGERVRPCQGRCGCKERSQTGFSDRVALFPRPTCAEDLPQPEGCRCCRAHRHVSGRRAASQEVSRTLDTAHAGQQVQERKPTELQWGSGNTTSRSEEPPGACKGPTADTGVKTQRERERCLEASTADPGAEGTELCRDGRTPGAIAVQSKKARQEPEPRRCSAKGGLRSRAQHGDTQC